jgi:WhiB family redox-sensing transcriptional regulator
MKRCRLDVDAPGVLTGDDTASTSTLTPVCAPWPAAGPRPATGDPDWRRRAACAGLDTNLFFPAPGAHPADTQRAKAVCRHCPVAADCLAFALETDDSDGRAAGIFGGLSPRQRAQLRRALEAQEVTA